MTKDPVAFRHLLHQSPELSGYEAETARRVIDFVKPFAPSAIIDNLGGYGVAVVYDFGANGPTLLFRCETDALPIQDINTHDHRSTVPGVSHKCGHDGHAAIVASLAPWLSRCSFSGGRVVLLFQPAEETGKGAKAVIEDARFAPYRPDFAFALHNVPGYPLHEVVWVAEQFSPTVQSIAVSLFGKESHASEPENGINPTLAIADLIRAFDALVVADPARPDFALLTPVCINMGQKQYGISAGYGELHLTLRTWTPTRMNELVASLEHALRTVTEQHALRYETAWFDYFPTTFNDARCNEAITTAAVENGLSLRKRPTPFKFGEDFGWFTQHFRGAMFGLGAGETVPALHNPDYDFPDALIASGGAMFRTIITQFLVAQPAIEAALPTDVTLVSPNRDLIRQPTTPIAQKG